MANPRLAATMRATLTALAADYGPPIERYAFVLNVGRLYRFLVGNTATADSLTTVGATGGTDGRWTEIRTPDKGADLTDAAVTIYVSGNRWRVLPATTLSTNRVLTLGTTNAASGDWIEVTRLDATGNTYAVVNGGVGAGTLVTFSAPAWGRFYFDGTNWSLRAGALLP